MNERILELAKQSGAWDYYEINEGVDGDEKPLKDFAELIVWECANICFTEAEGHSMAFGEHCGIVIKEHFGVEK